MRLHHLAAVGFRNLKPVDLELDRLFHVFHGANGHGKTNTLEAIYFLATLKPLRGHRSRDLIQWDEQEASVSASCEDEHLTRRFRVDFSTSKRVCRIDGKKVHNANDYFGGIRCVAFTPEDGRIVLGEPELRRNWIDRAAFTKSPVHLQIVRQYHRLRSQKSAIFREPTIDHDLLDVLNQQIAVVGAQLICRRMEIIEELKPHIQDLHKQIVGIHEPISMSYKTSVEGDNETTIREALLAMSNARRMDEIRRKMVLVGPHRDDVDLKIDQKPARLFGSRGQIRSIVLAVKLAELTAAMHRGQHPVFLLDDLSSELDTHRTQHLVQTLEQLGTQVFITTTDPKFLRTLPSEKTRFVAVNNGVVSVGGMPV